MKLTVQRTVAIDDKWIETKAELDLSGEFDVAESIRNPNEVIATFAVIRELTKILREALDDEAPPSQSKLHSVN